MNGQNKIMSDLTKILSKIVSQKGFSILSDKRLIYILMDYHAFVQIPPLKRLFTDIVSDGICKVLVSVRDNEQALNLEISKYEDKLSNQYGYDKCIVDVALNALCGILSTIQDNKAYENNKRKDTLVTYKKGESNSIRKTDLKTNKDASSVIIKNGILKIEESAFEDCNSLNSIVLPNSIKKIDRFAFYGCSNLHSIVLPKSLQEIADYAFYKSGIGEIYVKSEYIKLGDCLFGNGEVKIMFYSPNILISPRAFWGTTIDIGIPRGEKDEFMQVIRNWDIQSHVRDFFYFDP